MIEHWHVWTSPSDGVLIRRMEVHSTSSSARRDARARGGLTVASGGLVVKCDGDCGLNEEPPRSRAAVVTDCDARGGSRVVAAV